MLRLLLTKAVPAPSRFAVLIGHVSGVMMRLRPKGLGAAPSGPGEAGIAAVKSESVCDIHPWEVVLAKLIPQDALLNFYTTHIVGSKTGLPLHATVSQILDT